MATIPTFSGEFQITRSLNSSATRLQTFGSRFSDSPLQKSSIASSYRRSPTRFPNVTSLGVQLQGPTTLESDDESENSHVIVQTEKITQIHDRADLEEALADAGNQLVVIKYGASHSVNCARIYPTLVQLSQTTRGVKFLLIVGDESPETEALCREANVTTVPYFKFIKNGKVIHEEQGVDPEQMFSNVMYYGKKQNSVIDLHGEEDVTNLVNKHKQDHSLVVLDISLNHCGPCARIYPTVVKLADQMEGSVVFAKMDGDENKSTRQFLTKMNVKEVPTFLFIRDGNILGRYVGSGRGDLIGEVLRYQGVECT